MYLILATVLGGLGALAVLGVVIAVLLRVRLTRHARAINDAEQLRRADLSAVVMAHVPLNQRTNDLAQEMALAKEALVRKLTSNRRALAASGCALLLLAAANVVLHTRFKPAPPRVLRETAVGVAPPPVDALASVAGTWGWKYNALLSCKENPHTITVSNDQKHLSVRFRTPLVTQNEGPPIEGYDYTVIDVTPSELVLRLNDWNGQTDLMGHPLKWTIHFEDRNTYFLRRSDIATQDTGEIVRCGG